MHVDAGGDRRLVGYYVSGERATRAVREELQKVLPAYMVPAVLVQLDALPLTSNGKVDRGALPPPGEERPELDTPYEAPRDESERILADIWADTLKVTRVGINDNFFDLGGDSILAVGVGARASQYGLDFAIGDLFSERTIAGLCERIRAGQAERGVLPGFSPARAPALVGRP